jgi:hypothetical protein
MHTPSRDTRRLANVGARVCWNDDQADQGTITENDWSGVEIVWDNAALLCALLLLPERARIRSTVPRR